MTVICHVCYNEVTDDQHRHTPAEVGEAFLANFDADVYGTTGDKWFPWGLDSTTVDRVRPYTVQERMAEDACCRAIVTEAMRRFTLTDKFLKERKAAES